MNRLLDDELKAGIILRFASPKIIANGQAEE